ncbi:strn-prov protein [Capsaspora owczarzaki ATCC 30864]|uniref:Strn-prov protein n=1 Tax=Capsaspora owczarzaki (strain ATCC 30864) TaxID=595528 RepID=A0A0D2VML2_CAPO3|nr:strn-prov protein [Capsaspora owczarzaki ATCC 30864]
MLKATLPSVHKCAFSCATTALARLERPSRRKKRLSSSTLVHNSRKALPAAAPAAAAAAASAGQETHSAGAIPAPVPIVVETVGKKATVATEDEVLADFDFLSEDETAGADSTAAPAASAASSGSAAAPAASASASASAVDDVFASLDDAIEAGESSTTTTTTTTTTTEAPVSPAKSPVSATVVVSSPSASAPEADLQSFMPRKGSKARAGGVSKAAMAAAAAALASSEEEPEGNETKYDSNQLAKVMKHWDKTKPTSRKASHGKSSTKSPSKSSIMDMFGSSDDNDTNRGGNSVTEADVLGELADLSVAGDSEQGDQQRFDTESGSHHQWKPKYTFRGHFDSVRSIAFHDTEPAVLSASDDGTIKLWNFKNMPSGSKKSTHSPDLDPIYTYRGHTDAVTSIATSIKDGIFFTGSLDATVRVWRLYPLSQPAYANFDPLMSIDTFKGHTDAVWSLSVHPVHDILASISADKTCILWHFKNVANPLARKIVLGDVPTSVAFIHSTLSSFAISFASGKLVAYDNTTGNKVLDFERGESPSFINQVVSHPTLPLLITANDDKTIQFFDATGGQCTHSMVAHLDSVSTVAIDHSGLFLLSGGHDSSLRLWDIAKKSCLQEIASHRKKFDEAVHHVLFHPTLPFVASSGADASVKIYV